MRICYLAPADSIHTIRWLNYFAERDNEIHLISLNKPSTQLDSRVVFHSIATYGDSNNSERQKTSSISVLKQRIFSCIPPYLKQNSFIHFFTPVLIKLLFVFNNQLKIHRLIREIKPDIIHAHYLTVYGLLGVSAGFHPIYISVWGSDLWVESRGLMKYVTRWIIRKSDGIHCDGENVYLELFKYDNTQNKINIIHYGTDVEKFKPIINNNKKNFMCLQNCTAIISIRSLLPIYDIYSLIRAVPYVLEKYPDAHFFIAGKGSEETNLKNLSKSLKIEKNVHFIGNIPNENLPDYFRESDIYVSTSLSDGGLAASTSEAMACELPVIITDFGDNSKWISNGVNGYLIPLKSPEELAKKINYLIENREVRISMGKKAREIIVEKNNYFKEMDKVNTIYVNLIKGAMK